MKKLITYGHHLTKEKFIEARYSEICPVLNKPHGGVWASPIKSNWGWKDWCKAEDYEVDRLNKCTTFELKENARILTINSLSDFNQVLKLYKVRTMYGDLIDWNKLRKDFDVVYLTEKGNNECHLPIPYQAESLNSWDCESLVILRWEVINEESIKWKGK